MRKFTDHAWFEIGICISLKDRTQINGENTLHMTMCCYPFRVVVSMLDPGGRVSFIFTLNVALKGRRAALLRSARVEFLVMPPH